MRLQRRRRRFSAQPPHHDDAGLQHEAYCAREESPPERTVQEARPHPLRSSSVGPSCSMMRPTRA